MGRRVFLDVGGHVGETLEEVVDRRWRFDRIWTFEPSVSCLGKLEKFADGRVDVVAAGWWIEETELMLHDPGSIGASIAADKALTERVETCHFVDAAVWLEAHLEPDDLVWLKLNCEGAECDVIEHLLDHDRLKGIAHILVHFDAEKVPSLAHRPEETRRRLDAAGVPYVEAGSIMFGRSHALKTANWLRWSEAGRIGRFRFAYINRFGFRLRQWLYPLKSRMIARRTRRHP